MVRIARISPFRIDQGFIQVRRGFRTFVCSVMVIGYISNVHVHKLTHKCPISAGNALCAFSYCFSGLHCVNINSH